MDDKSNIKYFYAVIIVIAKLGTYLKTFKRAALNSYRFYNEDNSAENVSKGVAPAYAGAQKKIKKRHLKDNYRWIPAFAGTTIQVGHLNNRLNILS